MIRKNLISDYRIPSVPFTEDNPMDVDEDEDLTGSTTDDMDVSFGEDEDMEYETSPSDIEEAENVRRERIRRLGFDAAVTINAQPQPTPTRNDLSTQDTDSQHIPGEARCSTPSPNRYGRETDYMLPRRYRKAQRPFINRREATEEARFEARLEETSKACKRLRAKRRKLHSTQPELGVDERHNSDTPPDSSDSYDDLFDRYL